MGLTVLLTDGLVVQRLRWIRTILCTVRTVDGGVSVVVDIGGLSVKVLVAGMRAVV